MVVPFKVLIAGNEQTLQFTKRYSNNSMPSQSMDLPEDLRERDDLLHRFEELLLSEYCCDGDQGLMRLEFQGLEDILQLDT